MITVYVCSPLRGLPPYSDEQMKENLRKASEYSREVMSAGHIPITPHLYFSNLLDDKKEPDRNLGMKMGVELLKKCDELWVFGTEHSEGMIQEIETAQKSGLPVKYLTNKNKLAL